MARPESVFELLDDNATGLGRVPNELRIDATEARRQKAEGSHFRADRRSVEVEDRASFPISSCLLPSASKITFAKHIRNRANALINLLPFRHDYQRVLKAIAYIDWQHGSVPASGTPGHLPYENGVDSIDHETYLGFAGISSNDTAVAYLDWLEPKLRNWLSRYEQMLEVHRQELNKLIVTFDRERTQSNCRHPPRRH